MVTKEQQRIENCRDAMLKAKDPQMKRMWKNNYNILMRRRVNEAENRLESAARRVH